MGNAESISDMSEDEVQAFMETLSEEEKQQLMALNQDQNKKETPKEDMQSFRSREDLESESKFAEQSIVAAALAGDEAPASDMIDPERLRMESDVDVYDTSVAKGLQDLLAQINSPTNKESESHRKESELRREDELRMEAERVYEEWNQERLSEAASDEAREDKVEFKFNPDAGEFVPGAFTGAQKAKAPKIHNPKNLGGIPFPGFNSTTGFTGTTTAAFARQRGKAPHISGYAGYLPDPNSPSRRRAKGAAVGGLNPAVAASLLQTLSNNGSVQGSTAQQRLQELQLLLAQGTTAGGGTTPAVPTSDPASLNALAQLLAQTRGRGKAAVPQPVQPARFAQTQVPKFSAQSLNQTYAGFGNASTTTSGANVGKSRVGAPAVRRAGLSATAAVDALHQKVWRYNDPSGQEQGPFSTFEMRAWHMKGYFMADLMISHHGGPYRRLGDVFPVSTAAFEAPPVTESMHTSSPKTDTELDLDSSAVATGVPGAAVSAPSADNDHSMFTVEVELQQTDE